MYDKLPILTFCKIFKAVKYRFLGDFHIEYEKIVDWHFTNGVNTAICITVEEKQKGRENSKLVEKFASCRDYICLDSVHFLTQPSKYIGLFWRIKL